jgi:hypothetical protein
MAGWVRVWNSNRSGPRISIVSRKCPRLATLSLFDIGVIASKQTTPTAKPDGEARSAMARSSAEPKIYCRPNRSFEYMLRPGIKCCRGAMVFNLLDNMFSRVLGYLHNIHHRGTEFVL